MPKAVRSRVATSAVALLLGCGGPAGDTERGAMRAGSDEIGGSVVSTVDGRAIRAGEVRELAYATGLSMREALSRLQAEQLLMAEAVRRGRFERDADVVDVARRAAVQALLDAEAGQVVISDEDVSEAYQAQRARFETKEERVALHLLVSLAQNAPADLDARARAYVSAAIEELKVTTDLDAFQRAHSGRTPDGVPMVVERLPSLARVGRLVEPFEDAMFSLAAPGVVPAPVRTSYGWHAIRVLEIKPGSVVPYETAAATLRKELRIERQTAHVAALLKELRRQGSVVIAADADGALARLPQR